MKDAKLDRRILLGVFAAALVLGAAGRSYVVMKAEADASIVDADEQLRDAVASLPPAVPPAAVAPSRVAVWASPALRRAEAEKVLLSRRLDRVSAMMAAKSRDLSR
ncbi:MAG: hypothetical protein SF051_11275 [Elusimicrobiota bacterium]|nr:hypothetical protein [Elusimicrobiota bacterium]